MESTLLQSRMESTKKKNHRKEEDVTVENEEDVTIKVVIVEEEDVTDEVDAGRRRRRTIDDYGVRAGAMVGVAAAGKNVWQWLVREIVKRWTVTVEEIDKGEGREMVAVAGQGS
ncbi:hypothetical protein L6452_22623 [Arctium lappa]|uniref:Uncharacterized protein n=1 Tax=Arctium lappa TaxID=4217 RepID=A0ACB9AZQ1_ARCLA|nr:hypothetical protein L6452_22623 [Arctium lappa]